MNKAEVLIAAKHLGIESSKIRFSHKLEWVGCDGKLALSKASIDRTGGVTVFLEAIHAIDETVLDVLKEVVREFNEEDHPRDEDGKFTFGGGGGSDSSSGDAGGDKPSTGDKPSPSAQWTKTEGGLSERAKEAIIEYTDLGEYWNKSLRHGEKLDSEVAKHVRELDKTINNSKVTRNVVVFRGVGGGKNSKVSAASFRKAIGKTIVLKGYTSTSKDEESAKVFGGTLLVFAVPKGSKALDLTKFGGEEELLFPHKMKVEVVSVKGKQVLLNVV